MRLVSEARVHESSDPGQIIIEHTIAEVDLEFERSAFPEPMHEHMEQVTRERESSMMNAVIRETFDSAGNRLATEIQIPNLPPFSQPSMELAATSLLIPPACTGGQPIAAGDSWTQVDQIPSLGEFPIPITGTLDCLEDLGEDRVAVIQNACDLHIDAERDGRIVLGVESEPGKGTIEWTLQGLDVTWSGEDRHRLEDGLCILSTQQVSILSHCRVVMTNLEGERDTREMENQIELEIVSRVEPLT
jgi:hypothetical protein